MYDMQHKRCHTMAFSYQIFLCIFLSSIVFTQFGVNKLLRSHRPEIALYNGLTISVVFPAEGRECVRLSRKAGNVNALLVPGRSAWTIKHPWFKNPISIVNKMSDYDIWRQNLAWFEILTQQNIQMILKLVIGWSKCPDFKHMHLAERWVPGKTMWAFTLFSLAPDTILWTDMW